MTLSLTYPLLALHLSGSAVAAGWIAAAGMASRTLVHVPVGLLVDRYDPRVVMAASHGVRILGVLSLAGPVMVWSAPLGWLAAAAAVHAVCASVHETAATTIVPYLVPRVHLAEAAGRNEARTHAAVLAGHPLGGALFGLAHALPVLVDVLLSSVCVVLALRVPRLRTSPPVRCRWHRELAAGIGYLRRDRFLVLAAVAATVTNALFRVVWLIILTLATAGQLSPLLLGGALVVLFVSGGPLRSLIAPKAVRGRRPAAVVSVSLWAWVSVTGPARHRRPRPRPRPTLACGGSALGLGRGRLRRRTPERRRDQLHHQHRSGCGAGQSEQHPGRPRRGRHAGRARGRRLRRADPRSPTRRPYRHRGDRCPGRGRHRPDPVDLPFPAP